MIISLIDFRAEVGIRRGNFSSRRRNFSWKMGLQMTSVVNSLILHFLGYSEQKLRFLLIFWTKPEVFRRDNLNIRRNSFWKLLKGSRWKRLFWNPCTTIKKSKDRALRNRCLLLRKFEQHHELINNAKLKLQDIRENTMSRKVGRYMGAVTEDRQKESTRTKWAQISHKRWSIKSFGLEVFQKVTRSESTCRINWTFSVARQKMKSLSEKVL